MGIGGVGVGVFTAEALRRRGFAEVVDQERNLKYFVPFGKQLYICPVRGYKSQNNDRWKTERF